MKIFIDFDDVIFNAKNFKNDLKKIFYKFGISEKLFDQSYYNYPPNKKDTRVKTYVPEKQIKTIKKEIYLDDIQLQCEFEKFITNTKKYVFPDVVSFLNNFSKKQLFLISHGSPSFQKNKINNSGVGEFFNVIKVSKSEKSQEVKKIIQKEYSQKKETYFFLDDRMQYIEEIKKSLPDIITILVTRKEGRYADKKNKYCDFSVSNLKQALKIIQNGK